MHGPNHSTVRGFVLAVAVGLLGALAACSEDVVQPAPLGVAGGRIAGTVRTGGEPVELVLRATRISEKPGDVAEFDIAVDWRGPQGVFQKDLPAGRYVATLRFWRHSVEYPYRAGGLGSGDVMPDTLLVDAEHSPVTLDFDLATLRVRVNASRELDGARGTVKLLKRDTSPDPSRSYHWYDDAVIVAGTLDVTLAGVLPGAYQVEVEIAAPRSECCWPYGNERFWIPGVRDAATAPWTDVGVDQHVDLTLRIDHDPSHIQGEIVGAWLDLELLGPPSVALVTPDSTVVHDLRSTDRDGRFDLRQSIPGPVKVLVEHDGIVQWVGGRSFSEAQTFELAPSGTVSGVQVVQSALQIEIQTGDVGGANLRLYDASTLSLAFEWLRAYTGASTLTMPNLLPGHYLMHIEPRFSGSASWIPQWYDRASTAAAATPIGIDHPGQIVPVSIALELGATVTGTVYDSADPMDTYFIYITRADDPARWGDTVVWSSRPSYRFNGVPDGAWKIGAWRRVSGSNVPDEPPADTVWFPSTIGWNAATPITVVDHADVADVDIVIPAPAP